MTRATRRLLTLAALLISSACGLGNSAGMAGRPRSLPNLITFEEIQQRGQFSSLYELVQELRPRWLRPQGPDSFGASGKVQVHMDGNRIGSVEVMRNLSAHGVTSIAWLGPIDAAARFGLDHGHGAIIVSTAPVH
jgi:hypothetical protein